MTGDQPSQLLPAPALSRVPVPAVIAGAGDKASEHFLEFFAATIRNRNTRAAYVQAAAQFFRWCEEHGLGLASIRPLHVSAYIESKPMTAPSIKQLAALRGLFSWLVIKQAVPDNLALFVKGPKFSRQTGITPIMEARQMRLLLDSIRITRQVKVVRKHGGGLKEVPHIKGLRDRAAIAIMAYTFARVSAVVGVKRGDYRMEGKRARLRLLEKGNKEKLVWLHHEAEQYLDAYLEAAGIETRRRRYFRRWIRRTGSRARPSPGATCCVWLRTAAGPRGCRRSSATIHSGEPALRYFCITAGHSKLPRTWRIIPIRGQPSYMIEGKDLATLSEIERRIAFE